MALLALALSTLAYGLASFLQGVGIGRATDPAVPALTRTVRGMATLPFLGGIALDVVGVGLSALALRELPLFLVQAAGVASVGVTAVLATVAGARTDRARLWRGLAAGIVACGLLTAAADPAPATPLPELSRLALGIGIPVAAAVALLALRRAPHTGGLLLTALAGLAFAGVGLCLRGGAWTGTGALPTGLLAAVVLGITGTLLFAVALERCSVTLASGVLAFTELVVPSAAGLLALGDRVRPGLEVAAVVGCVLVVVALVELTAAESGADHDAPGPAEPYAEEPRVPRSALSARA